MVQSGGNGTLGRGKGREEGFNRKDIDSFAKKNELSELQNSLAKVSSKKKNC